MKKSTYVYFFAVCFLSLTFSISYSKSHNMKLIDLIPHKSFTVLTEQAAKNVKRAYVDIPALLLMLKLSNDLYKRGY